MITAHTSSRDTFLKGPANIQFTHVNGAVEQISLVSLGSGKSLKIQLLFAGGM